MAVRKGKRPVKKVTRLDGKQEVVRADAVRTRAHALAFCAVLAAGSSWQAACTEIDVARSGMYHWYNEDPDFRAMVDDAIDAGTDGLEDEAVRRGKNGYRRPVYQGGELVGYERVYSDNLLVKALAARRPNKWAQNRIEVTGKDGGPVAAVVLTVDQLKDEAKRRGLPTTIFEG